MVFVKIKKTWYITRLDSMHGITMMAYDNVDYLYDDRNDNWHGRKCTERAMLAPPWVKMEIWMQNKFAMFNEQRFNNLIVHFETTGQKVEYV